MTEWWNSNAASARYEPEIYAQRRREMEKARIAEELRLEEEQSLIDSITDEREQLRLRRERYSYDDFQTLSDLEPWPQTLLDLENEGLRDVDDDYVTVSKKDTLRRFPFNDEFNSKIYLHQGDITKLEVDGIVNAANNTLLGGGGIDGAIHRAAGPLLLKECRSLGGCETGQTKVTKGYNLPAKYVLHTVGPFGKGDSKLQSCYKTSLEKAKEKGIRSLAFCCVGTGIYSFPLVRAAHIALRCVREWLELNPNALDAVVFCTFQDVEFDVYLSLMPSYFPSSTFPAEEAADADKIAVLINSDTIAAEKEAEKRESERYSHYYRSWMNSAPDDEDEQLKAEAKVPRNESNASLE